jgi:copper(I)-binding protein
MSDQEASTTVRNAFVPVMKGGSIDMKNAGALAVFARGDVTVREGGAQMMLAGGALTIEQGGAQTIVARGDVSIHEGGALAVAAPNVEVTDGWVGMALGARVDISGSRVLLAPRQALCFGAGFGVVITLARRLLRR